MLKIKDEVDLKELEKFGFWKDTNFTTYHRAIASDYIEQLNKAEYLIINKNRVIVKGKIKCILDFDGNSVTGYLIQTNRVKRYCNDLIQANLVEKVDDE